jgi:hypothetical protein
MAVTELNRFAPEVKVGQLAMTDGNQPNVLNVMFKPTTGYIRNTLKPGDTVAFQTGKSLVPLVKVYLDNNPNGSRAGVVLTSQKKDLYHEGDMLEIAIRGSIVWMKARSAIRRGYKVDEYTAGGISESSGTPIGIALDDASADELLRVSITGDL